jgi:hypothetical protein
MSEKTAAEGIGPAILAAYVQIESNEPGGCDRSEIQRQF